MINQLMTQLSNISNTGKYQHDNIIITRMVVYWVLPILKKIRD